MIPIYIIQKSDKSICRYCGEYVDLLIEKDPVPMKTPIFFICFDCRRVFQAGVGEVKREEDTETE